MTAAAAVRCPRVLVVDDDLALDTLYAEELGEEGYQVFVARSGDEALARIDEVLPDVVTLDVRMPGRDGIETLRAIKARRPGLPVLLNTAYEAYKDDFGSWACDEYVVKSSDLSELKAAIHRALACGGAQAPVGRDAPA